MYIKFVHSEIQALGIEYLSAVLKKLGHKTQLIVDPYFPFLKNPAYFFKKILGYKKILMSKIFSGQPDLIAFSVTSYNMEWACELALELKRYSSVPVVFGGIQATLIPEAILNKDVADFVVLGEGEYAFLELVQNLENRNADFRIKNIWLKKDGELLKNPLRDLIEDLDDLPFSDKELFPYWLNRGLYRIITARGCLGDCTYCCTPIFKRMYHGKGEIIRHRSVGNVIDELKEAKIKYRIKRVIFEDDLFISDREWVRIFSERYREKVALPCLIHATPKSLNEEMVRLLRNMMCYSVELGVQCFNQKIREEVLNRYYSNRQIEEIVSLLKKNGINCICDNIIGLPGENRVDIIDMVKFYNRLRPGKIEVLRLEYYPKAPIVEKAYLTKETCEKINNGELIISKGRNPIEIAKIMLLLGLSYIFPQKVISFIHSKGLHRFLPYINDFNHMNEFIFYISSIFKKNKGKSFISFRADVLYKFRYLLESIFNGPTASVGYKQGKRR